MRGLMSIRLTCHVSCVISFLCIHVKDLINFKSTCRGTGSVLKRADELRDLTRGLTQNALVSCIYYTLVYYTLTRS